MVVVSAGRRRHGSAAAQVIEISSLGRRSCCCWLDRMQHQWQSRELQNVFRCYDFGIAAARTTSASSVAFWRPGGRQHPSAAAHERRCCVRNAFLVRPPPPPLLTAVCPRRRLPGERRGDDDALSVCGRERKEDSFPLGADEKFLPVTPMERQCQRSFGPWERPHLTRAQ